MEDDKRKHEDLVTNTSKKHEDLPVKKIPQKKVNPIVVVFFVIFLFCAVMFAFFTILVGMGQKRISDQTAATYNEYHTESGKVVELSKVILAADLSKEGAATVSSVNKQVAELEVSLEKAKKDAFERKSSKIKPESAYRDLSSAVSAGKEYITLSYCASDKVTPYLNAEKQVEENFRTYGVAQSDGNYSPEIARQQKVKDGLNKMKDLHKTFKECLVGQEAFINAIDKDTAKIGEAPTAE